MRRFALRIHRPLAGFGAVLLCAAGCQQPSPDQPARSETDLIAQGQRLVEIMDCNTCHTPKVLTAEGPRPDPTRLLSGHPAGEALPPLPEGLFDPDGWGGLFNHGLTAWAGPWGVSFGSNLTPDSETGTDGWTEEMFAEALRTGTHVENTKPFLPPMPAYPRLTDEELRAMFAYLQSIPPVRNPVPAPLPPPPQ